MKQMTKLMTGLAAPTGHWKEMRERFSKRISQHLPGKFNLTSYMPLLHRTSSLNAIYRVLCLNPLVVIYTLQVKYDAFLRNTFLSVRDLRNTDAVI